MRQGRGEGDSAAEDVVVPTVAVDNRLGIELAMQHLLDLGRTRIAYVGAGDGLLYQRVRFASYRAMLKRSRIAESPDLIISSPSVLTASTDAALEVEALLEAGERFDAVLCESDGSAATVLRSLRRAGLCVPEDVSVIGFDDSPLAPALDPPLTTVRQPLEQLGRKAVELLLGTIAGGQPTVERTLLAPTLKVRKSTQ